MKTYEEKTQCVFQKIEEETAIQKKRRRTVKRVVTPMLSLCLVAVIGFGAWRSGAFQKPPMISTPTETGIPVPNPDGTIQRTEMPDTIPTHPILRPGDEGYVAPAPTPNPETDTGTANEVADIVSTGGPDAAPQTGDGQRPAQLWPGETADVDNSKMPGGEESWVYIPAPDDVSYLTQWGNKTVLGSMADTLDKAPADKVFAILAHPYIDYEFAYKGHTLVEYYSDMCDERNLPEVLGQLIKEGDSLKYGSALYEGGAPNGEKWAQSLYDERVAFYGTAILDKYIVDGEFLRSQVESDLEAAKNAKEATKTYKAAFAAYYQHLVDTLQISIPADVKGNDGIVLHMTAGEFRNFTADHIEAWSFSFETPERVVYYATDD